MTLPDPDDAEASLTYIRTLAEADTVLTTLHGAQEMLDENITRAEVLAAVKSGRIIENYPGHQRGPCCLLSGKTNAGRPLHVVVTTSAPVLILITTYEPKMPKWIDSMTRNR